MWQKCWNFYRQASEEAEKKEYDEELGLLKAAGMMNREDVIPFILKYQDKPYFNIDNLLGPTFPWLFGGIYDTYISLHDAYARELQGKEMKRDLIKKIINYKAEHHYLAPDAEMLCGDYLDLEKVQAMVGPEVIKRAQKKMILRWIRLSRSDQPHDMDDLKEGWKLVYDNSQLISQQFLQELAKKFGMEFYLNVMGGVDIPLEHLPEDLLNKNDITAYDVALFFNRVATFSGKFFKKLLEKIKSNLELQNFVRGYIYADKYFSSKGQNIKFFILDEDLNPMDQNYNNIPFSSNITALRLRNMPEEDAEVWRKIFDEFGVIPQ